jgi:pyrroloquinoline-quinone synthase
MEGKFMKKQLQPSLERWNLLNHPFYQAWSAGTLPLEALRDYAREYGAFISLMPQGWETVHDEETAHEEEEHIELWEQFASALDTRISAATIPQVQALMNTTRELFSQPATALGALYAFEAQQPPTAQSKLDGLKTHYSLPTGVQPYFEVHSHNHHEAEKLLARMEDLNPDEQAQAAQACEQMAQALWDALSGIYDKAC